MQKYLKRYLLWSFIALFFLTGKAAQSQGIQVNLTKGSAQIGVSLGEVSDNELSVPISLSYNATGVQISEKGYGEFGLGVNWNLNAGGSISREVRALPDDFKGAQLDPRKGWLIDNTAQVVASHWGEPASSHDSALTYLDSEPDLYTVAASGLYVTFLFDNNKQIRTIPYQDVKIVPYFTNATDKTDIYKFEITTNKGVTYEFSDYEITNKYTTDFSDYPPDGYHGYFIREYNLYGLYRPTFFKSKWHLSKVSARDGRMILLSYEDATPFTYSEPKSMTKPWSETGWSVSYDLCTVHNTIFRKRLTGISSTLYRVHFNYNHGNFQAYDRIDFFDSSSDQEKKIKSFSLNYRNVFYKDTPSGPVQEGSMRRFLESVSESTGCSAFPPQRFSYYGVDFNEGTTLLPRQGSFKQDLWGFFNDSPDITVPPAQQYEINGMHPLTPKMYYYEIVTEYSNKEYYLPDSIPGWSEQQGGGGTPGNYIYAMTGRKRSVNSNTVHYGSLSKIVTSYGGYTQVEYEPNDHRYTFVNGGIPDVNLPARGIRVKKVTTYDGINHENDQVKEYEYKDADGSSSGRLTYLPQFSVGGTSIRSTFDMSPSSDLYYKRVTVKETGKGKTVFEYLVPAMWPALQEGDWKVTNNYRYPFSPNMEYDFERGLPFRKYEYKEGDNLTPARETQYEYQRISMNPVEVKAIHYDYTTYPNEEESGPLGPTGSYKQLTNIGKVLLSEKNYITDPVNQSHKLESTSSYFYEGSNHKFLTRTTTENSDGTIYETKTRYVKDFSGITAPVDEATTALKVMNDNFMHGVPVETVSTMTKGGTSKVLSATLTKYRMSTGGIALPAQQLQFPSVTGYTPSSIQPVTGGLKFVQDARYIVVKNFETYKGLKPLTINDNLGRRKSFHWGHKESLPVVEISGAAANQVVFSNFETATGNDFTLTNPAYIAGHLTGKALSLPANTMLQAEVNKGLGKYYRFTCKIKTTASGNITLQLVNGTTNLSPVIIPFTGSTKWQFIEKQVEVTAAANQFILKVSSNAALTLDDVAFYPLIAAVRSYTYDPALGKTSETDAKGNAVFYEYDHMSRVKYIRDGEGNILKKNEYKHNNFVSNAPKSGFTASYSALPSLHKNDVATYTSEENCQDPVSHSWYVNGSQVSSAPNLAYTFNAEGNFIIKHTVTHATTGSSTTERNEYVFSSNEIKPEVSISGSKIINSCDASYSRTFRILHPDPNVMYAWEVFSYSIGRWQEMGTHTEMTICRPEDYTIRCKYKRYTEWLEGQEIFIHFMKGACPVSLNTSCPYPFKPEIDYGIYSRNGSFVNIAPPNNTGTKTCSFTVERMRKFGPYDETSWIFRWEVFENNQWVVKDNFTDLTFDAHQELKVLKNPPYVNYKVRCSASPGNPNVWYTSNELDIFFDPHPPVEIKPGVNYYYNEGGMYPVIDTCARGTYKHAFMVNKMGGLYINGVYWPEGQTRYSWQVFENGVWSPLRWFREGNFASNFILTIEKSRNYKNYKVRCIVTPDFRSFYSSDELSVQFIKGNCP